MRARQAGLGDDGGKVDAVKQRHKQEQTSQRGAEGAWGQVQAADVGDSGDLGFHRGWALLVGATGETGEALFAQQQGEGIDADGVAGLGEFPLDVVDGEVAFAQGYRQLPDAVASRGRLGAAMGLAEEGGALEGVMAELMTQDAEGAWGIGEAAGDVGGGFLLDEEGAEGLVLALEGELGGQEELLVGWSYYLIHGTGGHMCMIL